MTKQSKFELSWPTKWSVLATSMVLCCLSCCSGAETRAFPDALAQAQSTPTDEVAAVGLAALPPAAEEAQAAIDLASRAMKAENNAEALILSEQAIASANKISDLAGEARAYNLRSAVLHLLKRPAEAVASRQEEAKIWRQLGIALYGKGDLQSAENIFRYIVQLQEALDPKSVDVAKALNNLALVLHTRGDLKNALRYYRSALPFYNNPGVDPADEAACLNNLGSLSGDSGDLKSARNYYQSALEIRKKINPQSELVAQSLNNLGTIASLEGDLAGAKRYYEDALSLREKLPDSTLNSANILNNLGSIAQKQGDLLGAKNFLERALRLHNSDTDLLYKADILNNLGSVASDSHNAAGATKYYLQALAIREKLAPDSYELAATLNNLGRIAYDQKNISEAQSYYLRTLAFYENQAPESLDVANSCNNLGAVALEQKDLKTAQNYHERALAIYEKQAPESLDVANSLSNLGALSAIQGNRQKAMERYQRAWHIALSQANLVTGDEAGQAATAYIRYYANLLLTTQIQMGRTDAAFVTLEQGRARSLNTLLLDRRLFSAPKTYAKAGKGANRPDASSASVWDAYQSAVRSQNAAMQALTDAAVTQSKAERALAVAAGSASADQTTQAAQGEVNQAKAAFQTAQDAMTQARLRAEARYADLKRTVPNHALGDTLSPATARQTLPADAVFAAFSVGKQESTLFLFRRQGAVQTFPIKITQNELSAQVANLREAVNNPSTPLPVVVAAGKQLFVTLFPTPQARALATAHRRLIISPDDVLWDVPFSALVLEDTRKPNHSPMAWLGLSKSLTVTPSLAVLARVRQQARPATILKHPSHAGSVALVVGDPLFERGNPSKTPPLMAATSERRYLWTSSKPPAPLPGTRDEARKVAALYGSYQPLLGDKATEAAVRQRITEGADVLHLATHGVLRRDIPTASGILLAAPVHETGNSSDDGALQAWEIASLDLSRIELTVLSACETARGTRRPGEGLIGLTRSLQAAGCRSVISSQWPVSDKATTGLMVQPASGAAGRPRQG